MMRGAAGGQFLIYLLIGLMFASILLGLAVGWWYDRRRKEEESVRQRVADDSDTP